MNDLQIKYFLTAARRLNFSEAAKDLFITQPALSQQIAAIEDELGLQLFIRDKNKLRLTPAAAVLMRELPECTRRFQDAIDKARLVASGYNGKLRIGILEGQTLSDNFRAAYHAFRSKYPDIHIELTMESFRGLRQGLDAKRLDVAFTILFDVRDRAAYQWIRTDHNRVVLLASAYHPTAQREIHGWEDLRDETIIIVDTEECAIIRELVVEDCEKAGFSPRLLMAPSLDDQMLWIDAGLGVGVSNTSTYTHMNQAICCLKRLEDNYADGYFVLAWPRGSDNSSARLFTDFVAGYIESRQLLAQE